MSTSPQLSILIVNYNGARFLPGCLRSIDEHVACPHEVIVVDNASTDGSVELLSSGFPHVRLIANDVNMGFAAGSNIGAREARGAYLLLLNNDVLLVNDLAPAVALLEEHPSIGIVGAKMLGADHEYRFSAGYFPTARRLVRIMSMYRRSGPFATGDFPERPGHYPIEWVEGSFLMTRRALWERTNGLDDDYFMYVEDVDYCRTVLELGYETVYTPRVSYIHFGGFSVQRMVWTGAGFRRYHQKHSRGLARLLAAGVLVGGMAARAAVSGLRYLLTRDPEQRDRMVACRRAIWQRLPVKDSAGRRA